MINEPPPKESALGTRQSNTAIGSKCEIVALGEKEGCPSLMGSWKKKRQRQERLRWGAG